MSPLCIRQACRYANLVISACLLLSMLAAPYFCKVLGNTLDTLKDQKGENDKM